MPTSPHIIVAAADAGSARAVAPVVRRLVEQGARVSAALDGPAASAFLTELPRIPRLPLTDASSLEAVTEAFREAGAQAVLTGAGTYNEIEHQARLAARRLGIPSVAVLDYWYEYESRFHRGPREAALESWPDVVCALDEHARLGLVDAGCRPERIAVTGPPNLEEAVQALRGGPSERAALAAALGVSLDRPIVAFFSEPHRCKPDGTHFDGPGGLYGSDGTPRFGYTAIDILTHVADAFVRASAGAPGPQLIVKPHPLEWSQPLHEFAASRGAGCPIVVSEDAQPRALVALADAVIAMSSVTLLEAALVGTPAYSVQIGLTADAPFDPCVGNMLGLTVPVFDRATLDHVAAGITAGRAHPTAVPAVASLPIEGAAVRAAAVVLSRVGVAAAR